MGNFASDNTAPVHPKILEALSSANTGHVSSSGADPITERLSNAMRNLFKAPQAQVFPAFNGSAANSLALSRMIRPYEAVICHAHAHINSDECGMPEFFSGGKLLAHHGDEGKLSALGLEIPIALAKAHAPHASRPRALSITQSTELGTTYKPDELLKLSQFARKHDLYIHMDGARFANAVSSLGCDPAAITTEVGVDMLSFGGTKNGAMGAEAVVIFNPELAEDFDYLHKRAGQLASKSRYISAQLLAQIEGGLWLDLARHANAMATGLSEGLADIAGVSVLYPVEANAVFVRLPKRVAETLRAKGHAFYDWPLEGEGAYRLVCSWATERAEIEAFLSDCHKGAS